MVAPTPESDGETTKQVFRSSMRIIIIMHTHAHAHARRGTPERDLAGTRLNGEI